MAGEERRAPGRTGRRGPAPIASFDHDGSDESSPDGKQSFQLPEIREHPAGGDWLAPGAARARSHSTPGLQAPAAGPGAAAAPRIDISRASSSSHHDSRDSSPELALFAGDDARARGALGFREDGALDLRSSTEELAFLEGAPGPPPAPAPPPPPPAPAGPASRRHSRKDSQGSEAALLGVSGRTSRVSSVGSQCSALSALSRASRLSVVSAASRSPSPHKMLLETSFCGPKPIDTDPELCAAAVEERLLEMADLRAPAPPAQPTPAPDARDCRHVHAEVTVESAPRTAPACAPPPPAPPALPASLLDEKRQKETRNRARVEERRARPRVRREPSQPEVYSSRNRSKDIIRIRLKPADEYEDDDESERAPSSPPAARPTELARAPPSPSPSRRSPSPGAAAAAAASASRKSSFCSLFKSRETIGSPDSPSGALRRKKSLTEGRSRSKSRERAATPGGGGAAGKLRGSVMALFKTPRRGATSPSGGERAASPGLQPAPAPAHYVLAPPPASSSGEKLKYYEDGGIIHIPLRTPPDELPRTPSAPPLVRPSSAPQPRAPTAPPAQRAVLPDGSIIIPLHSPTETAARCDPSPAPTPAPLSSPPPNPERCASAALESRAAESSPEEALGAHEAGSEAGSEAEGAGARRRQRLVFTTHVGSAEQVFSTQLSITKTPSVSSQLSASPAGCAVLRDSHIAADGDGDGEADGPARRDSSGSEGSAEGAPSSEAERRGLVLQESLDDELPYVPTTLPLERPLALPMVPVRDRALARTDLAGVQRPRAAAPLPAGPPRVPPALVPAPPPAPAPAATPLPEPDAQRIRIRLPRRSRAASAATVTPPPAPPRAPRTRTRSGDDGGSGGGGGGGGSGGARAPAQWIDFEEVPERRKQPKRIQTLPGGAAPAGAGDAVFSYVEPDECRCECHAHAAPAPPPATRRSSPESDPPSPPPPRELAARDRSPREPARRP